jgi:hypothetical protein
MPSVNLGRLDWFSGIVNPRHKHHFQSRSAVLLLALLVALTPNLRAASSKERSRAESDALFTNLTLLRLALEIPEDLKGGSGSFRKVDDRPGFTLDFNRNDPEGRFHGLKKMHLNNGAQDPARLGEFLGGQFFRDAGVPAARAAHALVELNGRRLGLYVIMESMDKDFLGRNFTNKLGNLYGQTRSGDVTNELELMEGPEPGTRQDLKMLAAAFGADGEDSRRGPVHLVHGRGNHPLPIRRLRTQPAQFPHLRGRGFWPHGLHASRPRSGAQAAEHRITADGPRTGGPGGDEHS